jgi:uncharacterized protein YlxW (UPF0749 family)
MTDQPKTEDQKLPEDLQKEIEQLQKKVDSLEERVTLDIKLKRKK